MGSGLTNPTVPKEYHANINYDPVVLEKHSLLGTNCVVLPGSTLGEGAAVGACSLVVKSLKPWGFFMGIPAKYIKERDKGSITALETRLKDRIH